MICVFFHGNNILLLDFPSNFLNCALNQSFFSFIFESASKVFSSPIKIASASDMSIQEKKY